MSLLDLAPDAISIPTYASIWRAILGGSAFTVYLFGKTGGYKTGLALAAQQHFGAGFGYKDTPGSFTSTYTSNEGLPFAAKDALFLVDILRNWKTSKRHGRLLETAISRLTGSISKPAMRV